MTYYCNDLLCGTSTITAPLTVLTSKMHILGISGGASSGSGSGESPLLTPDYDTPTDEPPRELNTIEQLLNRVLSATGLPKAAFYAICAVCGVAMLAIILLFIVASIALA